MAGTTVNQEKAQLLEQMLEDLAGEELSEFDDELGLGADLDIFSDKDDFVEIDNYH